MMILLLARRGSPVWRLPLLPSCAMLREDTCSVLPLAFSAGRVLLDDAFYLAPSTPFTCHVAASKASALRRGGLGLGWPTHVFLCHPIRLVLFDALCASWRYYSLT